MNDLPDTLERLTERLEALERRVYIIESLSSASAAKAPFAPAAAVLSLPPASPSFAFSGGTFTVFGKSLLGIAGAYLLRALEESTDLPKLGVAVVAILYAVIWLVWAARTPRDRWFESTVFACTSAAILAPMLWELTLTFKVLAPAVAAAILVGFVALATALAWRLDRAPALSVAYLSSVAAAFALALGTHALLPFTAVILSVVALSEMNAIRDRQTGARILAAFAADGMIWTILFIYSGPESARTNYPPLGTLTLVAPAFALTFIVFAAATTKAAFLRKPISIFETAQTTIAFVLAAIGFAWLVPSGLMLFGWACLGLAVVLSVACARLFAGSNELRNYLVFSWWAFALFASGALLGFASASQTLLISAGAVCATVIGNRMRRTVLLYQGLLLLFLVAAISGAARFAWDCLIGILPASFPWSLLCVAICAAACYILQRPESDESRYFQGLRLVTAFLAIFALAALFIYGVATLVAIAVTPGAHHIALIRTGVICTIALCLAFSGWRWQRIELTRVSYGALAFVTVKLLVEDLRNPRLLFIAASIFLVATTLLAVPRLSRLQRRTSSRWEDKTLT